MFIKIKEILKKPLKSYQLGLDELDLTKNNIPLYARLLDNLAYSKLHLNDTSNIKNLFLEALKIKR